MALTTSGNFKMRLNLLMILFFFTSIKTYAFTLNNSGNLVFGKDEVTVNIAAGNCSNIGIDENELLSIAKDAVDQYWNKVPTSRLKLRGGSVKPLSAAYKTDTICQGSSTSSCTPNPTLAVSSDILITCNNNSSNFSSAGVLAVTVPNNTDASTIIGSLIMINDMSSNQFVSKSRNEKVAIIAHEIGHAFGLGHSAVKDSLMYYATVNMRQSLGLDDYRGISYLYPKQQPIACGSIVDVNNTPINFLKIWPGLFIGLMIVSLINYQLRYLKLRPRF